MGWIEFILCLFVGYWTSEWPRRMFPGVNPPLKASQIVDPETRLWARLSHPLIFLFTVLLIVASYITAPEIAPDSSQRHLNSLRIIFVFGVIGAATAIFELLIGISLRHFLFTSAPRDQEFFIDRERATKVGAWRLASCLTVNITIVVACRMLQG